MSEIYYLLTKVFPPDICRKICHELFKLRIADIESQWNKVYIINSHITSIIYPGYYSGFNIYNLYGYETWKVVDCLVRGYIYPKVNPISPSVPEYDKAPSWLQRRMK